MKKIIENRYLYSLLKTVLFSVIVHLFLLITYAFKTKNIRVLNVFDILDIDLFFPKIKQGDTVFVVSIIFLIILYWLIFIFTKPNKSDVSK